LQPGEGKRVAFTITRHDLEYWGDHGWIAEPGTFNVWIGQNSAEGLRSSILYKP
jgi:beta-glucosidase